MFLLFFFHLVQYQDMNDEYQQDLRMLIRAAKDVLLIRSDFKVRLSKQKQTTYHMRNVHKENNDSLLIQTLGTRNVNFCEPKKDRKEY